MEARREDIERALREVDEALSLARAVQDAALAWYREAHRRMEGLDAQRSDLAAILAMRQDLEQTATPAEAR